MENSGQERESDGKALRAFAGGDSDAFRLIFDRYEDRVKTYLYCYFKLSDLAEDLTQETFLRLMRFARRNRNVWPEHDPVEGLLMYIAARAAADEFRKITRRLEADSTYAIFPRDQPSWKEAADSLSSIDIDVQRALAALPESLREVARLFYLEGYRGEAVAVMTGLSMPATWSRLFRSRKLLTIDLQGYERS
jgi:RNA polymerase sigma factor (sigma-70 family)